MVVRLHPGQARKLSNCSSVGYQVSNHHMSELQSSTYRAEIHGSQCSVNTQSFDNACCASGLEITFESLPQTIDIRLIPEEDESKEHNHGLNGQEKSSDIALSNEQISNKTRQ